MTTLYKTDYVLFKDNKPVEPLDIIYAEQSVKDLFEDGFELEQGEQLIKMTELPIEWQEKYIAEINRLAEIHSK
tara:strand:- start:233 stop:454 length:222 start_codon:yes stop_codon:yes gene_type:complete